MASVKGLDELMRNFDKFSKAAQGRTVSTAVQAGALLIENGAKAKAAYLTGTLRRDIHTEMEKETPTEATALVGTNLEYAPHVEFGTKAHDILPKNKRALYWPGARHPVKKVRHPGTSPQPFLRPAYDEKKDEAIREMGEAFMDLIKQALP